MATFAKVLKYLSVHAQTSLLLRLSVFLLSLGLLSRTPARGDEGVAEATTAATEIATQKLEAAKGTVVRAFNGDTEAMLALFTQYLLPVVIAALVIFVGYLVAGFVGDKASRFVSKQVDKTLGRFAGKAVKTLIFLFVLMGVFGYFGFSFTSVAAILAAASFAVGMALAGTLGNFAAGIMLLIFRPFKVGDYVVMAGTEGTVEEIDLFTTQLDTRDNRRLIVPNGEVYGTTIENVTHNRYRRVDVDVGCDYEACLDTTRATLEAAIANIPMAVSDPPPQAYLDELGDSSVNWQVRVWCRPANYWAVRQDLTAATKKALDSAGIAIPYPQLDIHLTQEDEAAVTRPRRRDAPILQANIARHLQTRRSA
ncbi:mechanosensitive ion channel family protein [Planctomycetes bacterium K23_9]|uniref:Small-conductance mechanosensitive channel n=1 Tax=Stieleria marina TaxID=1930275 RepID=A0A517NZQ2_9BACT|nr:Small-conductance mechanosensitive channel [Planctomycetes bacterium K23_9]